MRFWMVVVVVVAVAFKLKFEAEFCLWRGVRLVFAFECCRETGMGVATGIFT